MTDKIQQSSGEGEYRFSFRLSAEEAKRFQALQDALQAGADKYVRITQRIVLLEALEALEAKHHKLLMDRERRAKQK